MTDDLDRRAALLMGWTGGGWVKGLGTPGTDETGTFVAPFRPTSNPVDTRALRHFVESKGFIIDVSYSVGFAYVECWRLGVASCVSDRRTEDGPHYDLLAETEAYVPALEAWAALESKEAQG